jgi:magnesium-transporting ATPase (P-type)
VLSGQEFRELVQEPEENNMHNFR